MKKYILFATAAIVALSGCVKDKETEFSENQVSFNATSGSLETRTYYGSETGNNQTFVNWKDGDEVTIMSTFSGGSRNPVNYTIENTVEGTVTPQKEIKISNAKIFPTDKTSVIEWGAGTNVFYGMYPKSGTVSGSSLSLQDGVPTMTCVIPATWSPNADELDELPYGYMFAKESTTRTTSVTLTFNPKFTAFCFTLKNDDTENSIPLSSLTLSSESQALNGTFAVSTIDGTVSVTAPNASQSAAVLDANKSVTVTFPKDFSIPKKVNDVPGFKTFTVVVLPTAYPKPQENSQAVDKFTDLTVTVTQGTEQNALSKRLKLGKNVTQNDPSTYKAISFDAGKKHNISVTLPDFTNYEYTFSVTQQPVDINYAASNVAHAAVQSFRSDNTPVSWRVKGYYTTEALAEAGGMPNLNVSSWNLTGLPASSSTSTPSDTSPQALSIGHDAITPTSGTSISSNVAAASINESIFQRAEVGTATSPINLSNPNGSSDSITESANCYIVNGPGFYKIPLVMGNGVKNNTTNSSSYDGSWFFDSNENTISDPVLSFVPSSSSANVHWQDVSGLISDVSIMSTTESGQTSFTTTTTQDNKKVYWLKFKVNKVYSDTNNKQQGNAVIYVNNGTNIIWSYHIWVTSHVTGSESIAVENSKSVLPVPIGWVTTGGTITPKTAVAYARLEQVDNNSVKNYAVMKLELPTIYSSDSSTRGYAAYYQFGRKDPFLSTNPGGYTSQGPVSTSQNRDDYAKQNIANAIKNPGRINHSNGSSWFRSLNAFSTLWKTSAGFKTIYDPSPAGYMVCDSDALYDSSYANDQTHNSITFIPMTGDQTRSGYMPNSKASDSYTISVSEALYIWSNTVSSEFNAVTINNVKPGTNIIDANKFLGTTAREIRLGCWVIPMKTN